ncbi:hypothetical protein ZWY2020_020551 [Hordeum vulgare]|nr:hypothetical protein ZWY2020_020551 [Hordeum vulgare]
MPPPSWRASASLCAFLCLPLCCALPLLVFLFTFFFSSAATAFLAPPSSCVAALPPPLLHLFCCCPRCLLHSLPAAADFCQCFDAEMDNTEVTAASGNSIKSGVIAHKADAPYLNTPIEHYHAMATIFGTTAASGINARSGNDLLSIEVEDEENGEVNTSPNVAESSHPKGPPKKKAKVVKVLEDPLVTTLNYGFKLVADALVKSGDDDDIPLNFGMRSASWENLMKST